MGVAFAGARVGLGAGVMVAGKGVRVAAAMGVGVAGWGVAVGAAVDVTGLGGAVRPQARDNRSKQKKQSQNRRIMYLVVKNGSLGF